MLDIRKVALNTAVLYLYLIINIVISLYLSRVIIKALGFVDFGILNVVSGIVLLLQFLNNTMSGSIQRYLSFELAKNQPEVVRNLFNVAVFIHVGIALLAFIIGESAGFWLLRNHLNIPLDRIESAEWVLHFVILIFMCTAMGIPCVGLLNARENMLAVSSINLLGSFGKLAIALTLLSFDGDRLRVYAVLLFAIAAVTLLVNYTLCWVLYEESHFRVVRNRKTYRELTHFAGWNLVGDIASIAKNQGTTILFNIFWGPAVNAANGIAAQINGQIQTFSTMINVASDPQVIKAYAREDRAGMFQLVFQATKICFFLMYTLCLPLFLEMELVLRLWLGDVPEYTAVFSRLVLVDGLVILLSSMLPTVARATGKIVRFQVVVGTIIVLHLPAAYLLLANGYPPYCVFFASILISGCSLLARMFMLRSMVGLSLTRFSRQVLVRLLFLVMMTAVPLIAFDQYVPDRIWHTLLNFFGAPALSVLIMWLFVLQVSERQYVIAALGKTLGKFGGRGAESTDSRKL